MSQGSYSRIVNCIFIDNYAATGGGAVFSGQGGYLEIVNCTIAGNSARSGGGLYNWVGGHSIIKNCIFRQNVAENAGVEVSQIYSYNISDITINYSCVEGWTGNLGGIHNFGNDPCFVNSNISDPCLRDYHLLPDSACIDAGDPNSDFGLEPEPDGGRINMGFYGNTPEATCKGGLVLQNYNLISRTRVNRTTFDYVYTMTLNNNSPNDAYNVKVDLLDAPNNVTVNDANASFDFIRAGTSVESEDTFAIRVDRAVVVDVTVISWRATYESEDSGTSETMFTTMIPLEPIAGDLVLDGVIDIEDLAVLLRQWLWEGETGAIAEDLTGDGKVNFYDISKLGEHWQE